MEHFVRPNSEGFPVAQVGTLNGNPIAATAGLATCKGLLRIAGKADGNPIAATAGLATLQVLQQADAYKRLRTLGQQLRSLLEATLREHHVPGQVLGDGPIFHMLFTEQPVRSYRDTLAADAHKHHLFHQELLHQGVLKSLSKGYVSLVHSAADIAATAKAFDAAMAKVAHTT